MSFSEMEEFPRPSQRHVVCLTHDEYSHIARMFALARALTGHGLRVTCALPRSSYDSYSKTFISSGHSEPSDTQLHVEPVEELHEHASNDFAQLQQKLREGLMHLMQRLQPPPSFLVADIMYTTCASDVAEHFCVPLFLFSVFPATSLLFSCHMAELIQRGILPFRPGTEDEIIDWIPGMMKDARVRDIPIAFLGLNLDGLKEVQCRVWRECAGLVLCNSSVVLPPEADAVNALSAWGARIYPVGPMLQADLHSKGAAQVGTGEDETCMKWLNEQPSTSVVFASFGGVISLTAEEVREVAQGLEACGQPFLWALRAIEGFPNVASALPEGFLDRVSGRGVIVAWAPQRAILSHPSVGCFLFHSGASSALEGIWAGVPMIGGFYKYSDQNTVHRMLADGCGVLFSLTQSQSQPYDSANRRSSLAAAIKEVLFGQGVGAAIRQRVSQLKAAMREAAGPGGSARRSLDQMVDVLLPPSASISRPELDLRGDASFSTHAHAHTE